MPHRHRKGLGIGGKDASDALLATAKVRYRQSDEASTLEKTASSYRTLKTRILKQESMKFS
ncbi:hypothetical protein NVV93_10060 [Pseudomonas sp. LS44]|uniref:hypothetical protein n=1 Tax=Pseudomonas sp. LS44 TaxID=1357074 RepID=UPI00215B0945|nr:hypothetical protein [Pseudomonas sp. LS44]UVE16000.1 hypothetical protein NVV93_10060 [Pseudomonas sp. LS44]